MTRSTPPPPSIDPWLVIDGRPVVHIHPPVRWRPGGAGWLFITDDGNVWEAGRGAAAVRAASSSADVDPSDREAVHALAERAGPRSGHDPVAIVERVATAWGDWFFGKGRGAFDAGPTSDPGGGVAIGRPGMRCPCGSGALAGRFKDERLQPAIACEGCRAKLLARVVEAELVRGLPQPWSARAVIHGENVLRRRGCDLVRIVAGEPLPTRAGHVTILCPTVGLFFVFVPDALAEPALEAGRFG